MAAAVRPSKLQLLDADEMIVGEVLCLRCGKSLIGQSLRARCANCAHPASDSLYGDYLIHADKHVVRRLVESARFLLYGVALLAGLAFVTVIASLLGARDFPDGVRLTFDALLTIGVISPLLSALGVLSLTTKGSAAYYAARYFNRRTAQRLGFATGGALLGLALALVFAPDATGRVLLLLWVTVPSVLFFHGLAKLMTRVPNHKLAMSARTHLLMMILLGVCALAVLFLRRVSVEQPQWSDTLSGATIIAVLGALGFLGSAFVLLRAMHANLVQVAR